MTASKDRADVACNGGAWGVMKQAGVHSVQGCGGVGCTRRPMKGTFQRDEGRADITPITFPAVNNGLHPLLFPPAASLPSPPGDVAGDA